MDEVKRAMKAQELVLSCPICYELFNNAVLLKNCGHSFCSLCIRRYLGFSLECPQCRQPATPHDILSNRILTDIIKGHKDLDKALELIQTAVESDKGSLECVEIVDVEDGFSEKCPLCSRFFSIDQLEIHASNCKGHLPKKSKQSLEPLPKPVYHLLKDAQLRSRLKSLGLKATGDRQTLIRRHSEYLLLHNSECDSDDPKSLNTLRRELERLERTWT